MRSHLIIFILFQLSANQTPGQIFLDKLDNLRMLAEVGDDMVNQENQFIDFIINFLLFGFIQRLIDNRGAFLDNQMIDQLYLVVKIKIECPLCDSRFLGNLIDGYLMHLIAGKQFKCCFFNPLLFLTLVY